MASLRALRLGGSSGADFLFSRKVLATSTDVVDLRTREISHLSSPRGFTSFSSHLAASGPAIGSRKDSIRSRDLRLPEQRPPRSASIVDYILKVKLPPSGSRRLTRYRSFRNPFSFSFFFPNFCPRTETPSVVLSTPSSGPGLLHLVKERPDNSRECGSGLSGAGLEANPWDTLVS